MFDTHAHLSSPKMLPTLEAILCRAEEAGVASIVNIATDELSLLEGLSLAKKYPWIYTAGATTPHDVEKEGEAMFPVFERAARRGDLVAIGETGLDYHYLHSPKEVQQAFLLRYANLSKELSLPLIIHCRDAFTDLFSLLSDMRSVLLHCFTGTYGDAKTALDLGWMISFSGILTFKNSEEMRKTAQKLPLSHLVIETDAPYLSPNSRRGEQNEPAFLRETASVLAALHGIPTEELVQVTAENGRRFFRLPQN